MGIKRQRTHHEEDLAQPGDSAPVPVGVRVSGVSVAAHQVLRQDHYEALEHDQEQPLLVRVGHLQAFLHTFYCLKNRDKTELCI